MAPYPYFLLLVFVLQVTQQFQFSALELPSEQLVRPLFDRWRLYHNKGYSSQEEEARRYEIFKQNLQMVLDHNANSLVSSYTLGLNQFSDISSDEFETKMSLGVNDIRLPVATSFLDDFADGDSKSLESFDWRERGAITPIKNVGSCLGGTWAFAAGDSLSSLNKILFGGLANFSAQEFLDCTKKAKGCRSGSPSDAFEYARTHSIAAAADYPFVGEAGACKHKEKQGKVSLKEFESIEGTDKAIERNMLKAVHNQPLTAVIDGSKAEFKSYAGGIYKGPCAESGSLSVLVVGYGSENGDKYWIIKNSWGTEWGENGYMKLERNSNIFGGRCGIYINVFYPTELGPPPSHFPPPPPPPSPSPPPPSPSPPPPPPRQRCYTQLCKAGEECCCYWAPCKFFHICCPKGKCGVTIFYPCKLI